MAKSKKVWMWVEDKPKINPTESEKQEMTDFFQPLIEEFKLGIKPRKDLTSNIIVDIYSKWVRNFFYLCEKWEGYYERNQKYEFSESKFVRMEFMGRDKLNFSYFRHTGKWWLVYENITMERSLKEILENHNFQPMFF